MPTMDDYKAIARGAKTPDEAEQQIIATYGELPDELMDPLKLAEVKAEVPEAAKGKEAVGTTIIDAHLSNFEQAYEGRVTNPKAVGYEHNVAGQGQPGTQEWVKQQAEKPAQELPQGGTKG